MAGQRSYGTGVVDGAADATVSNTLRSHKDVVCEGSSCAAEIGITIKGDNDYKTEFSLRDSRVAYGYYRHVETFSSKSVVEFFDPKK